MMGDVSPEICGASYKYGIINCDTLLLSPEICGAPYKYGIINCDTLLHLVGFFCMNFTMMHGSTNIKPANKVTL
jgi:hypothetical protein